METPSTTGEIARLEEHRQTGSNRKPPEPVDPGRPAVVIPHATSGSTGGVRSGPIRAGLYEAGDGPCVGQCLMDRGLSARI